MPAILSIVVAILCGGLMALTLPWLPMLLLSILLFLAALIVQVALGAGFPAALGWSCLSLAALQFAYVLVGRLPYRARRYPLPMKNTSLARGDTRRE